MDLFYLIIYPPYLLPHTPYTLSQTLPSRHFPVPFIHNRSSQTALRHFDVDLFYFIIFYSSPLIIPPPSVIPQLLNSPSYPNFTKLYRIISNTHISIPLPFLYPNMPFLSRFSLFFLYSSSPPYPILPPSPYSHFLSLLVLYYSLIFSITIS